MLCDVISPCSCHQYSKILKSIATFGKSVFNLDLGQHPYTNMAVIMKGQRLRSGSDTATSLQNVLKNLKDVKEGRS